MISIQKVHFYISFLLFFFLLFLAISGSFWSISNHWLKYPKNEIKWLIIWHQGDLFFQDPTGQYIRTPFCVIIMIGTILLFITGIKQLNQQSLLNNRNKWRRRHQLFGLIIGFPLLLLALTGGLWAIGRLSFFSSLSLLFSI